MVFEGPDSFQKAGCRDQDFPVGVNVSPANTCEHLNGGNVEGGSTFNNGHRSVRANISSIKARRRRLWTVLLICCSARCTKLQVRALGYNAKFWFCLLFWNIGFGVLFCSLESASLWVVGLICAGIVRNNPITSFVFFFFLSLSLCVCLS